MRKKILILGGGISGLNCAILLAQKHEVWISEKTDNIGGMSYNFACKSTDKCNLCGWCLTHKIIKQFNRDKSLYRTLLNSNLVNLEKIKGKFQATLSVKNLESTYISEEFDYIIIASGCNRFDAEKKPQYGYRKFKNVLTGYDLENKLRDYNFENISSIGFIQCIGSRNISSNALYCSKVCCRYALRMANFISYYHPQIDISIFYMDMQVHGKDINNLYRELKKNKKVNFIRGIPFKLEETPDYKISMRFEDTSTDKISNKNFDLVVLSVGLTPNFNNEKLSEITGINLGKNGFITTNDNYMTNIDGIYAIGTSTTPSGINNTIDSSEKIIELI